MGIVNILFIFSLVCLVGLFALKEVERRQGRAFKFSIWLGSFDNHLTPKVNAFFLFFRGEGEGILRHWFQMFIRKFVYFIFHLLSTLQKKYNTFKESSRGQYPLKNNGTNSDFLKQVSEYKNGNGWKGEENTGKEAETLK